MSLGISIRGILGERFVIFEALDMWGSHLSIHVVPRWIVDGISRHSLTVFYPSAFKCKQQIGYPHNPMDFLYPGSGSIM